jgi:hypothetical protein
MRRRALVTGIPALLVIPHTPAWAQERIFSGIVTFDQNVELPSGTSTYVFVGESSLQHGIFASEAAPISNTARPWQFTLSVEGLSNSHVVSLLATVGTGNENYFYGGTIGSVQELTGRTVRLEMQRSSGVAG